MRLIVDHRDFPFPRELRVARVVDVALLLVLGALVVQTVRHRPAPPVRPAADAGAEAGVRQIVLTVHPDGRWTLNGQLVPADDLETELRQVFATRPVKLLFVTAAPGRSYEEVLAITRRARAAGIRSVGVLPPDQTAAP